MSNGFYTGDFPTATTSANWMMSMYVIDDDTNQPMDMSDYEFRLSIDDEDGTSVLSATTEDATITRPDDDQIAWNFTAEQMSGLCAGRRYKVGIVAEDGDGNIFQIAVGDLPVIDGVVEP